MARSARRPEVPEALRDAWDMALDSPDPLIALAAARALRAHLLTWEARLAAEAVASGATWEVIGEAMGATRQAAWERFHGQVSEALGKPGPRGRYESEVRRLDEEVKRLKRQVDQTRVLARDPTKRPP